MKIRTINRKCFENRFFENRYVLNLNIRSTLLFNKKI